MQPNNTTTDDRSPDRSPEDRDRQHVRAIDDRSDTEREATIDPSETDGYYELYVVPDPESTEYRVLVLATDGTIHHVSTFDIADFDDEGFDATVFTDFSGGG